jgi:hypothetical protein
MKKLYADGENRGTALRIWVFGEWVREHGNDGALRDSHAWVVSMCHPGDGFRFRADGTEVEHCQPTALSAVLWCTHNDRSDGECQCVGGMVSRGACLLCDWEGPVRDTTNEAVEDAHDHCWPGWRDLPVVARVPEDRKKRTAWITYVNSLYPAGWLEQGGPIRTARVGQLMNFGMMYGDRHIPDRTGFGGYDLGVRFEPDTWVEPKLKAIRK